MEKKAKLVRINIGGKRMAIRPTTAFYIEAMLDIELLADEWNAEFHDLNRDAHKIVEERVQICTEIECISQAFKKVSKKPR